MSEPTIDEMLEYLEQTQRPIPEEGDSVTYKAIRAILEYYQESIEREQAKQDELDALDATMTETQRLGEDPF